MADRKYLLENKNNKLMFRTSSFKAEKTSVLHSGVYTKEFASMLFASGICLLVYMVTGLLSGKSAIIRYLILIIIFIVSFLGSGKYIFRESYLEAYFDNSDKTVEIIRHGLITRKREKIPFAKIKSVDLGTKEFVPENIDGIKFVQKISAQHGSAVPHLGDVEEFIILSLNLNDGSGRTIFAGRSDEEPEIPLNEIRNYLNI